MKKIFLYLLLSQLSVGFSQSLLADLRPGMDGSEPDFDNAKQKGNELFFTANPDGQGTRLYKTNGTAITLLEGEDDSWRSFALLGFLGDDLIYFSSSWINGIPLGIYKTNGTFGAGELIFTFNVSDIAIPYWMNIVKDGVMYFYGMDDNSGYELWRTDGTAAGTYMVKDINPGAESSFLYINNEAARQYFAELNGYIYFGAAEPVNGAELWRTDGTEAGTTLVANIEPSQPQIANMGSNPAFFCTYNNAIYFSAYRIVDGRELWKTDGTSTGTVQVKDIAPGDGSPANMIEHNGSLYFTAYHPNQGYTVYRSNGTSAGTSALKTPDNGGPESPSSYVKFKGKLYFSADSGQRLWYTDGTASGTNFLPNGNLFNSGANNLLATTNYIYFTANNGGNSGVYRTTEIPNQISLLTNSSFNATTYPMFLVNNCLLVRGEDGTAGEEIYTVCSQNTQPVGLDEMTVNKLAVYPNPCIDKVTITCEFDVINIQRVTLNSLSGQTMELSFNSMNYNAISVDGLSEFSTGIYLLSIEMNNGQKQHVKLIIE